MKRFLTKYGIFISIILILAIIALNTSAIFRDMGLSSFSGGAANGLNVILDAGHGGEDGGAVSISGTPEKAINLAVTLKTEQTLALLGVPCRLTREGDGIDYPPSAQTTRARKSADTRARAELVNAVPNAVLVSIHQNKFASDPRARGAQVFFAPTNGSERLAESLSLSLESAADHVRPQRMIEKNVYLMNHVACPAVLVECGFLSNEAECCLLESDDYQTKLAAAIAVGILRSAGELAERYSGGEHET
ncbi:MAG: N-acetylmuramoyl-L-alanine amidase [Oscillospiraceae bacterium]|nr:N-acetylmuramoyl-L-alanine amidase [Oscillospiraceae bacterium]